MCATTISTGMRSSMVPRKGIELESQNMLRSSDSEATGYIKEGNVRPRQEDSNGGFKMPRSFQMALLSGSWWDAIRGSACAYFLLHQ